MDGNGQVEFYMSFYDCNNSKVICRHTFFVQYVCMYKYMYMYMCIYMYMYMYIIMYTVRVCTCTCTCIIL